MLKRSFVGLFTCLAALSTAQATVEAVIGNVALENNINLASTAPGSNDSEIIISRDEYVISYNKTRRAPNWVAWRLAANQIGSSGRTNAFTVDTDLQKYLSQNAPAFSPVTATDYQGSCFDRGHQIPSGDRTDSTADNSETFFMSNMIPQTPYLNRVIWEHLEAYTRDLVQNQGKVVYVIAGPIYDINYGSIGPKRDIPVPSKDFKYIIILNAGQTPADITSNTPTIAVVMPNTLKDGSAPVAFSTNCGGSNTLTAYTSSQTTDDWTQYETTLANIESLSGLSFH